MSANSHPAAGAPPRPRWPLLAAAVLAAAVAIVAVVGLLVSGRRSDSTAQPHGAPSQTGPGATWAAGALRAPDFHLADENGKPVSLAALRGRPVIVTFIDPLCRNYCPLEARRLNDVVRSLPVGSRPAIVAVSVNVAGNARANLLQNNRKWRLTSDWRWGTGSAAQLEPVWKRYRIAVLVVKKRLAGVTVREVAHTEAAYVVDARGFQRALFLWPYRAQDVAQTVRQLAASTS